MSYLALNLLLAVVWVLLLGDFSSGNLLVGLVVGYIAITISRPALRSQRYVRAVPGLLRLMLFFVREVVVANVLLARDLVRWRLPFQPGFVAFDIRDLDRTETVVLANLVSLTPGTLSVDLDDAGDTLYVHALYAGNPDEVRASLRRMANLMHGAIGHPREPAVSPEGGNDAGVD